MTMPLTQIENNYVRYVLGSSTVHYYLCLTVYFTVDEVVTQQIPNTETTSIHSQVYLLCIHLLTYTSSVMTGLPRLLLGLSH